MTGVVRLRTPRAATQPYLRAAQHRTNIDIRTSVEKAHFTPHQRAYFHYLYSFEILAAGTETIIDPKAELSLSQPPPQEEPGTATEDRA